MDQQVVVNASTSVVQIDTSQITAGSPAVVYLSSIYAPGTLITIRDIAGQASATKSIIVSTTSGVNFLDGAQVSSYSITQPFGFLTVNPKTSTIWALMNTFAFPDQSAAALVNSITATNATASTIYSYQALISTAAISSISANIAYVRTNISVGQSTIANDLYLRSSLTVIGGISTAATLFASTSVVTQSLIALSTIQTPFAQLQFSTGLALDIAGITRTAGLISTVGPLYVGGLISTTSDLGVGGSTLIGGQLRVAGYTFLQSSLSTVGSFTLGGAANLTSSLTVKDNALFLSHASVASNMTVAGALSVMSSLYVKGALSVDSGLLLYGLLSTNSSINVGQNMSIAGNLAVGGDLFFNDRLLDLNNLSVVQCLYVGNNISTYSSITAGGSLQITGSTLFMGHVSTLSNLVVSKTLSTLGNFGLSGTAFLASTATIAGSVSTLSNLNIGGSLNLLSSATIGTQLSTLGQAAFFSSVQIQGGLSVFSSLAVSCNVDIAGILTAKGFNLGGAAVVTTLGVTQTTGYGVNISSSTLHYGHISTMSGIDMAGRFSTPNVIATGSTLFTSFATVQNSLSTLVNTNVGASLNVLGTTTLGGTVAAANYATFSNGLSTITNTNVGGALNVLGAATVGGAFTANTAATFNTTTITTGVATFNAAGNSVVIANSLSMPGIAQAINATGVTANFAALVISPTTFLNSDGTFATAGQATLSSLVVQGSARMSNSVSTFGQVAIFSSLQVQGGLSVFSSLAINCNADIAGILTANFFQLRGGAIVSTLGIVANTPGWALNISSSTLALGLMSTSGSINVGRNLSTAGAFAVGGSADIAGNLNVQGTLSTVGQTSVGGAFTVLGATTGSSASYQTTVLAGTTVTANTSILTNAITGSNSVTTSALRATTVTVNTGSAIPTAGYQVDVAGAIRTTGNPLIQNASPGIILSNNAANANTYSIYTGPNSGGLVVTGSDNTTRIAIAPGGTTNVGINTNSPAFTLDVNGTLRVVNAITATGGVTGALTGNVTGNVTGSSGSCTGNSVTATTATTANALATGNAFQVGSLGIGTAAGSALTVNPVVADNNTFNHSTAPLTVTIPTATGATLNDQLPVAHFTRQGLGNVSYGARATFALSRWENNATNSRTRLDIGIAHDMYAAVYPMSIRSDGRVGINTTTPAQALDVTGGGNFTGTVTAPTFSGALSGNATSATTATTAGTANALNTANAYTVTNLTVTGTLTASQGASVANSLNPVNAYTGESFRATSDLIASNATANNGYLRLTTNAGICYIQSALTGTSGSLTDLAFASALTTNYTMILKDTGRLGIGTNITPFYLLDVDGTVNARSTRAAGTQGTTTFNYTGATQQYVVPEGCQMIFVTVLGAGGQSTSQGGGGTGGRGGSVSGFLYVTPKDILNIVVGGSGGTYAGVGAGAGSSEGRGGGYSGIFTSSGTISNQTSYLVIAGGGGGGGFFMSGGAGGGLTGATGAGGIYSGGGGSQTAGGAKGSGGTSTSGTSLQGGNAGGDSYAGGGGGGYYGGGGGTKTFGGGAGGGGSSFIGQVVYVTNVQGGGSQNNSNGLITIIAHYGVATHFNTGAALTNRIMIAPLGIPANPVPARTLVGFIDIGSGYGPWLSAYQAINGYGDLVDFSICTNVAANNSLPVERLTVKAITGFVGIGTIAPTQALDVVGNIIASGDITAFSDGRYKTNIATLSNALTQVCQMRGVYYTMKDKPDERKVGVIAQEIEEIVPEVVLTDTSDDKKKSVAYGNLTALLIEAVKTLTERLERLEEKLASGQ
jgi:predicted acyltransferase (DUF342 family)